jgi:hypothetical protein
MGWYDEGLDEVAKLGNANKTGQNATEADAPE